jgi:hypothetical protein
MTRQEFANVIALPLYQARRYLPASERTVGIPDFDEAFPPDSHLDCCLLPEVEAALNKETA